jgi:hypothetical protein
MTDFKTSTDAIDHQIAYILAKRWMTACGIPPCLKNIVYMTCFSEREIMFFGEGALATRGKPLPEKDGWRSIQMKTGILMGDPLTKVVLHLTNICIRRLSYRLYESDFMEKIGAGHIRNELTEMVRANRKIPKHKTPKSTSDIIQVETQPVSAKADTEFNDSVSGYAKSRRIYVNGECIQRVTNPSIKDGQFAINNVNIYRKDDDDEYDVPMSPWGPRDRYFNRLQAEDSRLMLDTNMPRYRYQACGVYMAQLKRAENYYRKKNYDLRLNQPTAIRYYIDMLQRTLEGYKIPGRVIITPTGEIELQEPEPTVPLPRLPRQPGPGTSPWNALLSWFCLQ